jgi:hypothetical protein
MPPGLRAVTDAVVFMLVFQSGAQQLCTAAGTPKHSPDAPPPPPPSAPDVPACSALPAPESTSSWRGPATTSTIGKASTREPCPRRQPCTMAGAPRKAAGLLCHKPGQTCALPAETSPPPPATRVQYTFEPAEQRDARRGAARVQGAAPRQRALGQQRWQELAGAHATERRAAPPAFTPPRPPRPLLVHAAAHHPPAPPPTCMYPRRAPPLCPP